MYKKRIDNYLKEEFINKGYANIKINVDNDNLYNELSIGNQIELNENIFEYIDNKCKIIPIDIPLKLTFIGNTSEIQKKQIPKLISEHYYVEKEVIKLEMKKVTLKMILALVFGALVFIVAALLSEENLPIFLELLDVLGWIVWWEGLELMLFTQRDLRKEYKSELQKLESKIEFLEKIQ